MREGESRDGGRSLHLREKWEQKKRWSSGRIEGEILVVSEPDDETIHSVEAGCVTDVYRAETERKDDSRHESPVSTLKREQMKCGVNSRWMFFAHLDVWASLWWLMYVQHFKIHLLHEETSSVFTSMFQRRSSPGRDDHVQKPQRPRFDSTRGRLLHVFPSLTLSSAFSKI